MSREKPFITETIVFPVEFYDVDSMRIVWHGNYVKYMEKARCALLDKIGFGYLEMVKQGYEFPVVSLNIKYIRSLVFCHHVRAVAGLIEYENCIKIRYEFYDDESGTLTTRAESSQMAVKMPEGETKFACPQTFIEKVEQMMRYENEKIKDE